MICCVVVGERLQAGDGEGCGQRRRVRGQGKAVKVARKAWSVSGKPGEGGDMKAEKESVREMWHTK